MAGKLKWYSLCLMLGLVWHSEAMGQETPKLRTIEGRVSVTDTANQAAAANAKAQNAPEKAALVKPTLAAVPVASKNTKKTLAERVKAILGEKSLKSTSTSIQIIDLDSDDIVYAHN